MPNVSKRARRARGSRRAAARRRRPGCRSGASGPQRGSPRSASRPCDRKTGASPTSRRLPTRSFRLARGALDQAADARRRACACPDAVRLAILNGQFAPELSDLSALPKGVRIAGLRDGARDGTDGLEAAPRQGSTSTRIRLRRSTPRSSTTARSSSSPPAPSSRRRFTSSSVTGGDGQADGASARAGRGGREQPGARSRRRSSARPSECYFNNAVAEVVVGEGAHRRLYTDQRESDTRVPRRQHPGARCSARACSRRTRSRPAAQIMRTTSASALKGEGADCTHERRLSGRRRAADRHAHLARSRDAALHQPRALQGHPGRQGEGRVQRPHHRPPRRAEDRRQADQPRAAAVGRGARSTRTRSSRSSPTM